MTEWLNTPSLVCTAILMIGGCILAFMFLPKIAARSLGAVGDAWSAADHKKHLAVAVKTWRKTPPETHQGEYIFYGPGWSDVFSCQEIEQEIPDFGRTIEDRRRSLGMKPGDRWPNDPHKWG